MSAQVKIYNVELFSTPNSKFTKYNSKAFQYFHIFSKYSYSILMCPYKVEVRDSGIFVKSNFFQKVNFSHHFRYRTTHLKCLFLITGRHSAVFFNWSH